MSTEWSRATLETLINAYKQQENLYNTRQKLYYNKQARANSMAKVLKAVQQKDRPETTLPEIQKKIQTLRTQFGQEVGKIDKSQALGEDLLYKPKIWWFSHLEWIGDFMKTRTDSTPLSAKVKAADEISETYTKTEYEYDTEVSEHEQIVETPPQKKPRTYLNPKTMRSESNSDVRTIEYTLINEDTNEILQTTSHNQSSPQFIEFEPEAERRQQDRYKRRSKAFGKYISALMMDITDDKIFFQLQSRITGAIQEANAQQHEIGKS